VAGRVSQMPGFVDSRFSLVPVELNALQSQLLILLVGAGRFERPTPCAQGGLRPISEGAYFQLFESKRVVRWLLNPVEAF